MKSGSYDPRSDTDLDEEQLAEVLEPLGAWFAFPRDRDYLEQIEVALPNAEDRWRLVRAWAFGNDKATNGLLSHGEADRIFGGEQATSRFVEAGLLVEHPEGWRLNDYLRVNFTRKRIGRKSAVRSSVGAIGGKRSGESRRQMKENRLAKQSLRSPEASSGCPRSKEGSTGTGTGTGTGTNANANATESHPSGDDSVSPSQTAGVRRWLHVDPGDLEDFEGLKRLHARASEAGVIAETNVGLFDLATLVARSIRKGVDVPAYLAQSLHRWPTEPSGLETCDFDKDAALEWIARADAKLAYDVAKELLEDFQAEVGPEYPDAGVVEYQRRVKLIKTTIERERSRKQ